jgi:hypothetical protein
MTEAEPDEWIKPMEKELRGETRKGLWTWLVTQRVLHVLWLRVGEAVEQENQAAECEEDEEADKVVVLRLKRLDIFKVLWIDALIVQANFSHKSRDVEHCEQEPKDAEQTRDSHAIDAVEVHEHTGEYLKENYAHQLHKDFWHFGVMQILTNVAILITGV